MITHQRQPVTLNPLGELAVNCYVQRREPVPSGSLAADMGADDRFGVRIEGHDEIAPAKPLDQCLGYLDALSLVRFGGFGFAPCQRAFGFQALLRRHGQVLLPRQAQNALLLTGIWITDNGCQPASAAFGQACCKLGIQQAFTSYNNPKGNVDAELVTRTLNEESSRLKEWSCPLS